MLAADLDALLDKLLAPVTADEQAHGWTPQAKAGFAGYVRERKAELGKGALSGDPGLVRGLDAWGVSDGDLYDEIMNFDRRLP